MRLALRRGQQRLRVEAAHSAVDLKRLPVEEASLDEVVEVRLGGGEASGALARCDRHVLARGGLARSLARSLPRRERGALGGGEKCGGGGGGGEGEGGRAPRRPRPSPPPPGLPGLFF